MFATGNNYLVVHFYGRIPAQAAIFFFCQLSYSTGSLASQFPHWLQVAGSWEGMKGATEPSCA